MDILTIVLGIILVIAIIGRCIVDWLELRDWWWEMIAESEDDEE